MNIDDLRKEVEKLESKRIKSRKEMTSKGKELLETLKAYYNETEKERLKDENLKLKNENIQLKNYINILKEENEILSKDNEKLKNEMIEKQYKRKYQKRNEQERIKVKDYKQFRQEILKRDNFTCQECGSKYRLQVHHIKSRKDYPELIMDKDNCITLCISCHSKTENFFVS